MLEFYRKLKTIIISDLIIALVVVLNLILTTLSVAFIMTKVKNYIFEYTTRYLWMLVS